MHKVTILILVLLIAILSVNAQEDSAEANKASMYEVIEALNSGDFSTVADVYSEDFVNQEGEDRDTFIANFQVMRSALTDIVYTPTVLIAQNELVVWHITLTGIFENEIVLSDGLMSVPPTGEPILLTTIGFSRFDETGHIVAEWTFNDVTALLVQFGIMDSESVDSAPAPTLDEAVGYDSLNEDERVATFNSGMEIRNTDLFLQQITNLALGTSDYYTDPYVSHSGGSLSLESPQPTGGPNFLMLAMPDLDVSIDFLVAEGDWIAAVGTFTGTFTEEVNMGSMTLSPTGEVISWQIAVIDRFGDDGLIVEEWTEGDFSAVAVALGMMPPMGE